MRTPFLDGKSGSGSLVGFFLIFPSLLAGCGGAVNATSPDLSMAPVFIAEDSDFASYQTWAAYQLPATDPLSDIAYPAGDRMAFLNQRPPHGATRYPVGTVILKAIEFGAGPQDWELFGMAKRGGGFNPAGAVDWEFFLLRIDASGAPRIKSRGVAPSDDGRGDMGLMAAAGGYFDSGQILPCNVCHGVTKNAQTDYMLGVALPPSATAE